MTKKKNEIKNKQKDIQTEEEKQAELDKFVKDYIEEHKELMDRLAK
jgi:hypothetical protein